ncbi:MAG: hypothetical protein KatS3mg105_2645 [Gemmatales bacterium]|nr:MAG: hypothetical protein KatS3mg105_2645 [Gemmatales bacterium]
MSALWLSVLLLGQERIDWRDIVQKPYEKLPPAKLGLKPLLVDEEGKHIATPKGWYARRKQLIHKWQKLLGTPPQKPKQLDARIEKTEKNRRRYAFPCQFPFRRR